jgi:hypothetical protein
MLILKNSTAADAVSTTVSTPMRRRQAPPTDAASMFSSILSRSSSDIEFACSCLQIPTTTSVTVTQTALSTTVITLVVNNNLTITPVTTGQTTETATILESVMTTIATSTGSSPAICTFATIVDAQKQAKDKAALDFLFSHNNLTLVLSSIPYNVLIQSTLTGDLLPPLQTALQNVVSCSYTISPHSYPHVGMR